jgi:hypothetical protein
MESVTEPTLTENRDPTIGGLAIEYLDVSSERTPAVTDCLPFAHDCFVPWLTGSFFAIATHGVTSLEVSSEAALGSNTVRISVASVC